MPNFSQYSNAISLQIRCPLLFLRADVLFLLSLTFGAADLVIACSTHSRSISSLGVSSPSPSSLMRFPPSSTTVRGFFSSSCSSSSLEPSSTNLFKVLFGCGCSAIAGPLLPSACFLLKIGHEERKQDEQVTERTGNVQIPNHFEDAARNNHIAVLPGCCYGN
jgi:hypothetical protein